jgi:hypothetical protein
MRDGAPPFSVMDFVWEEIKGISMNPQKTCGFTPYLMFIIEYVTGKNFPKEGKHMPFRPNPTKKPLIPLAKSPLLLEKILLLSSSKQHKNRSYRLVISVRSIGLNRTIFRPAAREILLPFEENIWAPIWHVSLQALKKERVTQLHLLSSAMQAMKALIHLNRLLPMLTHLT